MASGDQPKSVEPALTDQSRPAAEPENTSAEIIAVIHLMRLLGIAAHNAKTFEQILENTLAEICTHLGWPVGFAYVVEAPHQIRKLSAWYCSFPERYADLQRASERTNFENNDSLIGRVLNTGKGVILPT